MRIYKLLLFVVTLCFTFAGCISVKEWQIKHNEDSFDGPARQGKSVRNPFNDYDGLKDYRDNSLGFYAGNLPYRQPFRSPYGVMATFYEFE